VTDAAAARDKRWIALVLLCVAQFVVVLDASIVNVALPTIKEALDFSEGSLPWVVNAYVLTFGGFLLLGGRLADLLGRRRLFMAGLVLFALASLAGGLAANSGQLIAARAVQGLGAAILSPAALSIVAVTFKDGAERNKALGVWGAVAGSGGAAGVLLGGVLTEYIGWEWVLWVNVPIGILAAAIAPSLFAESRAETETRHFDVAGATTITLGLSAFVFALLDAESAGWGSFQTIGTIVGALIVLAVFVAVDCARGRPSSPSRSSASAPSPAPTWSASWSAPASSRCSISSRSTCSRSSVTARSRPGSPICRWRSRSSSPPASPPPWSPKSASSRSSRSAWPASPSASSGSPRSTSTAPSSPTSSVPPSSPPSASASPSSR
jgi:MFS family permease